MAKCRDQNHVRITRVDNNTRYVLGVLEPNIRPSSSPIRRLINAVPIRNVASNAGLACTHINHIVIGISYADGTHGRNGLFIKQWLPARTAVRSAPNASSNTAKVERIWIARDTRNGQDAATTIRANGAPLHAFEERIVVLVRGESNLATQKCQQ